jgi:colicin import membrane protein
MADPIVPAAQTAPEVTKAAVVPPAATPTPPVQPEPQKPADKPAQTPEQKDLERRAAALASAKRESARVHQEREQFAREKLEHGDQLKEAAEFKRLTALKATDPIKFLEEIGLSVPELSKQFIAKTTGAGKTPAELVKEEVARQREVDAKAAAAEKEKADAAEKIRVEAQALAGVKKQIEEIAKAKPEDYELFNEAGPYAVNRAWELCVKYHEVNAANEGYIPLAFDKAIAAVEAEQEARLTKMIEGGNKARTVVGKVQAAAAAKKKDDDAKAAAEKLKKKAEAAAELSAKPRSSVEPRPVETAVSQSPVPTPKRGLSPTRIQAMAQELWAARDAKQDN